MANIWRFVGFVDVITRLSTRDHLCGTCQGKHDLVVPTWLSEITLFAFWLVRSPYQYLRSSFAYFDWSHPISIDLHPLICSMKLPKKGKLPYLSQFLSLSGPIYGLPWAKGDVEHQASSSLMIGCCDMLALPNQAQDGSSQWPVKYTERVSLESKRNHEWYSHMHNWERLYRHTSIMYLYIKVLQTY